MTYSDLIAEDLLYSENGLAYVTAGVRRKLRSIHTQRALTPLELLLDGDAEIDD